MLKIFYFFFSSSSLPSTLRLFTAVPSIHAVNNRTLKMLHLLPLFIEMLFCYQIWHTKKYMTKRSIITTLLHRGEDFSLVGFAMKKKNKKNKEKKKRFPIRFWMSWNFFSHRELFTRIKKEVAFVRRQYEFSIHVSNYSWAAQCRMWNKNQQK